MPRNACTRCVVTRPTGDSVLARGSQRFALIVIFCVAGLAPSSLHAATQRIFDVQTTTLVAEVGVNFTSIPIASQRSHTVELRNFGPQSDPVVYLLNSSNTQVGSAISKNGGVFLSAPGILSGKFLVVVRSRSALTPQTGDLWVDGVLNTAGVTFTAGTMLTISQLDPTETLDGVQPPLGAADHVAYLLTTDGLNMLARSAGPFTAVSAPSKQDMLAVYATNVSQNAGALRVYRNDLGHDTDGDGLGDELEAALGTCASNTGSVAGVNCDEIADPRDTDGDGLTDGMEVLGREYVDFPFHTGYLPLPAWGANPRHKDIFIEVDYGRRNVMENQQGTAMKMTPQVARQMAAIYADAATTDFWMRAVHALSAQNPDRLPGVSLHLDIGVPPQTPADATIYGDWGGYNAVDASSTAPPDPTQVWPQQLGPGRVGVFHYVLGYTTGGGSCGPGIACGFNMNSQGNSAHEFGHTLGLNHNGPDSVKDEPNCKPNYPSLMNYAYLNSGYLQFSDGLNSPNLDNHSLQETNGIDPSYTWILNSLSSYFGYTVDTASGSVDWNRDGIFSPADVRVRAYANYEPGDDCEFTREEQQDSGLMSQSSPAVVRYKGQIWLFSIDLNGKLAYTYTTQPWSCYPNPDKCPVPVFQQPGTRDLGPISAIDAKTFSVNGTESIVLVAIRPDNSMMYTSLSVDDSGNETWGDPVAMSDSSPAAGEPSLANSKKEDSLVLAYKGTDNIVRTRSFTGPSWTAEKQVVAGGNPVAVYPNTSPAVAFTYLPLGMLPGQEQLVGAFIDPQGKIQLYSPQLKGQWSRIRIPYDTMNSTVGRPVMAWTPGPGDGGVLLNTGSIVPPASSKPGSTVNPSPGASGKSPSVLGPRIVGNRVPSSPGSSTPPPGSASLSTGRLYLLYLQYPEPSSVYPAVRMAISNFKNGQLQIGLDSYFDDVWSYAYGMSLLTPSDVGLRAAETYSIPKPESENRVFFRPHADGMADLTYKSYDDWKTIGWGLCDSLVKTQTGSPVRCAAPW